MPTNLGTIIMVPTTAGAMPMEHRAFFNMLDNFTDDGGKLVSQTQADEIIAEFQLWAEAEAAAGDAEDHDGHDTAQQELIN